MAHPANLVDAKLYLSRLQDMREHGGQASTRGLDDRTVSRFLSQGESLGRAIDQAYALFCELKDSRPDLLSLGESQQVAAVQQGIVNFYAIDAVNPYVAAGAHGPWVVSLKGAVIYDCGGYGMLGFGHAPDAALDAMNQPHVMANIMTPNVSQMTFVEHLRAEIGHTREDDQPFSHFICLNSGSESVTIASRLADVHARNLTAEDGCYAGRPVRGLSLAGSFHGRTDKPARYSDSSLGTYRKHLRSFADEDYLLTVEPNNIEHLESIFQRAQDEYFFIEAMFMEPVMGEGNPGQPISPEFYARARELTLEHGALLLVDSIQAGLRAHGVLSIVDYPGFQALPAPDLETYSKALNAGQYPLSVLAMTERAAELYRTGIYGNTMNSNPRALDVAVAVMSR
ncbi:MAG: aminotransferase class III-fold pyridoxal phosphate-dependent enzyme, partial [Pseudomonadota bacterium]